MNKYYMSSIVLMITSFIMLFLGFSYYKLEGNVSKTVYSDKNEYNDINIGLNYINTLPMNINIINEYFSDLNNLSNSNKEQILFSYIFKNNYKLYDCGSSSFKSNLCINKTDINNTLLLDKIGLSMFELSDEVRTYVNNYGYVEFKSNSNLNYYKVSFNNKSFKNNGYTEFYKYKRDKDLYVFYVYQGFYKANCTLGENISLFDYITGDVSYSGSCNGNHSFNGVIDNYDKLQLYKYELKKNSNGDFYLYGYNPVNYVSIG